MKIKRLPAGFVIPAQPVVASRPPSGPHWVHEIKHDGYRMIVRRDELTVRIYSRNAYDWTARLLTIASAAECIKAKSFTIDGEAVVLGPDGLSRLLGETKAGIVLNEHVVGMAILCSSTLAGSAPRASSPRRWMAPIDPVLARRGSRSAIQRASRAAGAQRQVGIGEMSAALKSEL